MKPLPQRIGRWSSAAVLLCGAAYIATGSLGMIARREGEPSFGLVDPALAILEALIVVSALAQVLMMAAVHSCAPQAARASTGAAFGFMLLLAGTTSAIHFVQLTVVRRLDLANAPELRELLSFRWLSPTLALDLLAWDVFLGLSLLCAVPAFESRGRGSFVRNSLLSTGVLCLAGALGPITGAMEIQFVGIAGYAIGLPIAALALNLWFRDRES